MQGGWLWNQCGGSRQGLGRTVQDALHAATHGRTTEGKLKDWTPIESHLHRSGRHGGQVQSWLPSCLSTCPCLCPIPTASPAHAPGTRPTLYGIQMWLLWPQKDQHFSWKGACYPHPFPALQKVIVVFSIINFLQQYS